MLAAADSGSFRQAALALGVQESAISRGVCELEEEVGFVLFERGHTGVRLTEAGKHYLPEVRAALRHLDQAMANTQSIAFGQRGRLRLAASEDVMTINLARVLSAHRARWPNVSAELVEMSPADQVHALRSGLVDLGLMLHPPEDDRLTLDPLWTEACAAVLPLAHSLTAKSDLRADELRNQRVIVGQRDRGFRYGRLIVDLLADMGISTHVVAEVKHIQTAMMMVQAGIGTTFVPTALVDYPSAGRVFRRLEIKNEALIVQAAWATDDPSGLVAQFLRTAREVNEVIC